jgi:hypothetical protein
MMLCIFPFGPPRQVRNKEKILGKAYRIKVWCYWEHIGEPIGNFVKSTWELYEKLLGTFIWGHKKNPKKTSR